MSALVKRIQNWGRVAERESLPLAFDDWVNYFNFGGMQYPYTQGGGSLAQDQELPPTDFSSYCSQLAKSNGVVFACMAARQRIFSQARFQFQRLNSGTPGDLFGSQALAPLEHPWGPSSTTGDLLARMVQDVDLAGNSFTARLPGGVLARMRPDWVIIVIGSEMSHDENPNWQLDAKVLGYVYCPGGINSSEPPTFLEPKNVAHFIEHPDPMARFRGMSWLTPVIREVMGDTATTQHKLNYFSSGCTPNIVVSLADTVTPENFQKFVDVFESENTGVANAYKTLFFGGGASIEVVGNDLKQMDFKVTQAAGEVRVAAASGVPPIVVGLTTGLESSTYCLPMDALVWTTGGPRPIGDVRAGEEVWSHVDGGIAVRPVTWQGEVGTKNVFTLKTKNRTLRATGSHPLLVRVPGNSRAGSNAERSVSTAWRHMEDVKVGDYVVQPLGLHDQGGTALPDDEPATVEVMQWLGAMIGDGTISDSGRVAMCMPPDDRAYSHYVRIPSRLFTKSRHGSYAAPGRRAKDGLTPQMVELHRQGLTYPEIRERLGVSLHPASIRDRVLTATAAPHRDVREPVLVRTGERAFAFHSQDAARWHYFMGVTGTAKTKRVPPWVFSMSEEMRLAFLAGIVDSDGSVDRRGSLTIHQANRALVEDLRMLAVSCGIQCCNMREQIFQASVLPNPGLHETYSAWSFVASSAVDVARIPFVDAVYRERVEINAGRQRRGGGDAAKAGLRDGLGFFKVVSIEEGPPEPVYDIEVEGGHSFIADGIVVHNSNYSSARRAFADGTLAHLWQNAAGSLQTLVDIGSLPGNGGGVRLWYDAQHIAFLKADVKEDAEVQQIKSTTINTLITAGFNPDDAVKAVEAADLSLLAGKHSGLVSVQLLAPGESLGKPAIDAGSNGSGNGKSGLPALPKPSA